MDGYGTVILSSLQSGYFAKLSSDQELFQHIPAVSDYLRSVIAGAYMVLISTYQL